MEVIDGNTISLKSLSHTIKVRLLAVAPPENGQPYSDVSRQHLSDLILGKFVVVRYTGIGEQGYLIGRVLLEQGDINAQMLRDGVAWYFPPDANDLAETDRQLYPACEQAARTERRGLWRDQSPIAPWEFRKTQFAIPSTSAAAAPRQQPQLSVRGGSQSELTSDDLMSGLVGAGTATGQPNVRQLSTNATPGSWVSYEPADRHFSILAPSDGVEIAKPILDENGNETNFHYVIGRRGQVLCTLMWAEGPNNKYTNASAVTEALQSYIKALNREIVKKGGNLSFTSKEVGALRLGDYVGKEYSLRVGEISGVVRLLSRQIGNRRELLLLTVMNRTADEASANQFLNSLKVNTKSQPDH